MREGGSRISFLTLSLQSPFIEANSFRWIESNLINLNCSMKQLAFYGWGWVSNMDDNGYQWLTLALAYVEFHFILSLICWSHRNSKWIEGKWHFTCRHRRGWGKCSINLMNVWKWHKSSGPSGYSVAVKPLISLFFNILTSEYILRNN